MRPIHVAHVDKARPVLVLTRETVWAHLDTVTVAPITTTVRGLSTEVLVGAQNGLDQQSAIACDHVTTVPRVVLGKQIGRLLAAQEPELSAAIRAAFDLE